MNDIRALQALLPHVEELYQELAVRPSMFVGRANSIEAFVMAIELVLDCLVPGSSRRGRYAAFRSEGQYGEEFFQTMFERQRHCRLGFIRSPDAAAFEDAALMDDEYQRAFAEHWSQFLAWRKKEPESNG